MRGAIICLVLATGVAHADPPAGGDIEMGGDAKPAEPAPDAPAAAAAVKDPKAAKKWLAAARELAAKGDALTRKAKPDDAKAAYENAVTAYENSIAAGDDAGVNLALGVVEDKLGRTDAAARHYRMVATAKTGVPAAVVKQAQAKFDDASTKVGLVTFTVAPDGATIANGEKVLGRSPLTEPLILLPGDYTLTLSADGFQTKDAEIKVEAGSESDRKVELEPIKIVIEKQSKVVENDEPPPPPPSKPSKVPVYVGLGVGAVAIGISIVGDLTARSWHNTYVAPGTSTNERLDAKDNGRRWAHIADGCLIGGGVAIAFAGAYYLFHVRNHHTAEAADPMKREVPKVDMIPWVQPDAGGLSFAGSF